jgi:hypothetical protein
MYGTELRLIVKQMFCRLLLELSVIRGLFRPAPSSSTSHDIMVFGGGLGGMKDGEGISIGGRSAGSCDVMMGDG